MAGGFLARVAAAFRRGHDRREVVVCAVIWGVVLLSVPLRRLVDPRYSVSGAVSWSGLASDFLAVLPFFALFLVNDIFFARLLVRRRKVLPYVLCALVSASALSVASGFMQPGGQEEGGFMPQADRGRAFERAGGEPPVPPRLGEPPDPRQRQPAGRDGEPPVPRVVSRFVLALLMMSLSVLVKVYLIADRDKERLRSLSQERTRAELAQLRYQLSPHFLMKTLNNIHALVDIDAERAKETILRLSRLMRHMLYDCSSNLTPLEAEVAFLRDYVDLMRLRYTSSVSISVSLPDQTFGIEVPPLIFVNMVENAFKHGVSYSRPSAVDVSMSISAAHDEVNFCCSNTMAPAPPSDGQHGIGEQNVRKRLELICPGRYEFTSMPLRGRYVVALKLLLPLGGSLSTSQI